MAGGSEVGSGKWEGKKKITQGDLLWITRGVGSDLGIRRCRYDTKSIFTIVGLSIKKLGLRLLGVEMSSRLSTSRLRLASSSLLAIHESFLSCLCALCALCGMLLCSRRCALRPFLALKPFERWFGLRPSACTSRSHHHTVFVPRSASLYTSSMPNQLVGIVFDMDGTLTRPNLDFKAMYQRVKSTTNHP